MLSIHGGLRRMPTGKCKAVFSRVSYAGMHEFCGVGPLAKSDGSNSRITRMQTIGRASVRRSFDRQGVEGGGVVARQSLEDGALRKPCGCSKAPD